MCAADMLLSPQNEEGMPFPLLKLCDFGYSKADFSSAAKSQVIHAMPTQPDSLSQQHQ